MNFGLDPIQHVLSYLTLRECVEYATTSKAIAAAVRWTIAARGVEWGVGEEEEGEEVLLERVRALWNELPLFALYAPASMQYGDARPRDKEATLLALRALPLGDLVALFSHPDYQLIAEEIPHAQRSVLAGSHREGNVKQEHRKGAVEEACRKQNYDVVNFLLDCRLHMRTRTRFELPPCELLPSMPLIELLFERRVVKVETADEGGSTLLHCAAFYGSLEVVRFLLARQANPNAEDQHRVTPLLCALQDGDNARRRLRSAVVAALLEGGADPNRIDADGQFPLLIASRYATIELLLLHNAQIEQQDLRGRTALHHHARLPVCIALLLRWGANPHSVDREGMTPLHCAVSDCAKESIELLFDAGSRLDQKRGDGRDAFDLAQGHPRILALLHRLEERGQSVVIPSRAGEVEVVQGKSSSPLFQIDDLVQLILSSLRVAEWASLSRLSQVARRVSARLMAQRAKEWGVASAHETQEQQRAALRALWKELPIVSLFVPAATQCKARLMGREALLDELRALPFAPCARLFLQAYYICDASPRAPHVEASLFAAPHPKEAEEERLKEAEVSTLLERACYYHHLALVHFLMAYGALERISFRGDSYQALVNDLPITMLLIDRHILTLEKRALANETLLSAAINAQQFALASLLVQRGADPNERAYSRGSTPLMLLIKGHWLSPLVRPTRSQRALLLTLLEAGADPNLAYDDNRALFEVVDPIQLHLLLDYGAEIDQRNRRGETALYHLAQSGGDTYGLIALLLQRGADPNATTLEGRGPLDVATRPEVIELLRAAGAIRNEQTEQIERS